MIYVSRRVSEALCLNLVRTLQLSKILIRTRIWPHCWRGSIVGDQKCLQKCLKHANIFGGIYPIEKRTNNDTLSEQGNFSADSMFIVNFSTNKKDGLIFILGASNLRRKSYCFPLYCRMREMSHFGQILCNVRCIKNFINSVWQRNIFDAIVLWTKSHPKFRIFSTGN